LSRFFLHQQIGTGIIEDPDGTELADLAAARSEAILAARQLLAAALLAGVAPLGTAFRISDDVGNVLLTIPFGDAVPEGFPASA